MRECPHRSPGSDGLPVEFYKTFKDLLSPILLEVYSEVGREGEMSPTMARGMIIMIYKRQGDPALLKHFRPLSMLNCDYKVLTRIFSNRLKQVLAGIIAPTQTYSIPGRDIADTVCSIRDVVEHLSESES